MRALDDMVRQGKVRYSRRASNFHAWRLAKALWTSDVRNLARFDLHPVPLTTCSPRDIEYGTPAAMRQRGGRALPVTTPWPPGLLTGKT